MTERLLTPREVADHCGLHYRTILRAIEAGDLPASRLRGRLRISRYDMLTWIQGGDVKPHRVPAPKVQRFAAGSLRALIDPEVHHERGSYRP